MTDLGRYADWVDWIRARASADDAVRVVFVAGSAATGGYDEWSDLDLEVLVDEGTSTEVYERLLAGLRHDLAPASVWQLPAATYPDGRQCFAAMQADPGGLREPVRIVDLHVHDLNDESRHVDSRRHGEPVVLHDPAGLLGLRDDPEPALRAARAEAVDQIRQRRPVAAWLVNRAIRRGDAPEAVAFYQRFALEPVVRLLRVRHCPERHDFSFRYLGSDLPAGLARRVDELLPLAAGDLDGLRALADRCFAWQDELLAETP